MCSIVKDRKKYDLLSFIYIWLSKIGIRTIYYYQFALDYPKWEEISFISTNILIIKDGKKYDDCLQFIYDFRRWEEIRFVASNLY